MKFWHKNSPYPDFPDQSVINLSKRQLSTEEESLLKLGLSFCPVTDWSYIDTRIDLFLYIRKLKLMKLHATSTKMRMQLSRTMVEPTADRPAGFVLGTLIPLWRFMNWNKTWT